MNRSDTFHGHFEFNDVRTFLRYLRRAGVLSEETLSHLAEYRFTGDVHGYAEGELYFPGSPVLTVEGTFGAVRGHARDMGEVLPPAPLIGSKGLAAPAANTVAAIAAIAGAQEAFAVKDLFILFWQIVITQHHARTFNQNLSFFRSLPKLPRHRMARFIHQLNLKIW